MTSLPPPDSAAPETVFTFRTTHAAIAAETRLQAGGVATRVMALPSSLGAGCGICLRVDVEAAARALALMAEGGIEPEGVYRKTRVEGRVCYYPETPAPCSSPSPPEGEM